MTIMSSLKLCIINYAVNIELLLGKSYIKTTFVRNILFDITFKITNVSTINREKVEYLLYSIVGVSSGKKKATYIFHS